MIHPSQFIPERLRANICLIETSLKKASIGLDKRWMDVCVCVCVCVLLQLKTLVQYSNDNRPSQPADPPRGLGKQAAGPLKRQLQSQPPSAGCELRGPGTANRPRPSAVALAAPPGSLCGQMSASPDAGRSRGHGPVAGVGEGRCGEGRAAVEPDHVALHQLEINRPRPPLTSCGLD